MSAVPNGASPTRDDDAVWKLFSQAACAWPFSPEDAPALAWWRTLPADLFRGAERQLMRATLDGITVVGGGNDLAAALRGDSAAAIKVVFSLMPIGEMSLKVDIAMTAVLHCALDGNPLAALALAHVLSRAKLGHPFATELSASWFVHRLHHSPDRCRFTRAETGLVTALRAYDMAPSRKRGWA